MSKELQMIIFMAILFVLSILGVWAAHQESENQRISNYKRLKGERK